MLCSPRTPAGPSARRGLLRLAGDPRLEPADAVAGGRAPSRATVMISAAAAAGLAPSSRRYRRAGPGRSPAWHRGRTRHTAGAPADWSVQRLADFNGDGFTDILWQHQDGTPGV